MSVRTIKKSYRNLTGKVFSLKNSSPHAFESCLERDLLTILDFDIHVAEFTVQPVSIDYRIDGENRGRKYTPDVLIKFRDDLFDSAPASWLCEVKYRSELKKNWPEYSHKHQAARNYARRRGWRFVVITEKHIHSDYLYNCQFLKQYRFSSMAESDENIILDNLAKLRFSSPAELLSECYISKSRRAEILPVLWGLISQHKIGINLTEKLTMKSEIWSLEY